MGLRVQDLSRAKRAFAARQYLETIDMCDAALAVDGEAVEFMKLRARALYYAKRVSDAAEAYEQMVGLVDPYPVPLFEAGCLRLECRDWAPAAQHFVRCVEWSLQHSNTYLIGGASLLAGYALVKLRDRDNAVRMLQLCEQPAETSEIWNIGPISRAHVLAEALAIPVH